MSRDEFYDSLLDELEDLPRDPSFHGAFAGGPPILSEEEAHSLFSDPEGFERRAQEALRKARERAAAEASH